MLSSSIWLSSEVDLSEDASLMPPLLSHVIIPGDMLQHSFFLPVIAPGNPVSWRLGGTREYYSADAGTPQGISVEKLSGVVTVDTGNITPGRYSVQFVLTDIFTGLEVSRDCVGSDCEHYYLSYQDTW